ncbi:unnamed protein product, partial [Discosporangium mesarthrocarpum]
MTATRKMEAKLKLVESMWPKPQSSFPFLRMLLPQLDNERGSYGMKTSKMATLYAKVLGFNEKSEAYKRLTHYTQPAHNPSVDEEWQLLGDFPRTLEYVLRERVPTQKTSY